MSKDSKKENAKKVIEEYTGKKCNKLFIHNDPKVAGCYAMKAIMEGVTEPYYFIKMGYDEPLTVDTIEDAEFDKWPPVSEGLKFFV